MSVGNKRFHRQSLRWKGYDYTRPGAYFITICTQDRSPLFGAIRSGAMNLSPYGEIVREEWLRTIEKRHSVVLDEWVVMPDHFHAIIMIRNDLDRRDGPAYSHDVIARDGVIPPNRITARRDPIGGERGRERGVNDPAASKSSIEQFGKPVCGSVPTIVRSFKSSVTKRINEMRGTPGARVWQRNYYLRIVRGDRALFTYRRYIRRNPERFSK